MKTRVHYLLLIPILLLLAQGTSLAQDYIYLLNGNTIEADIRSVIGRQVIYTPYGEKVEQSLRIEKDEINKVRMSNGTEVFYNQLPGDEPAPKPAAPSAEKVPTATTGKRPIPAQKLQRRQVMLAASTHFIISGGVALPFEDVIAYDPGYALSLEVTHYFSDYWGISTQLNTFYNQLQPEESGIGTGALSTSSLLIGSKVSTGFPLSLVRLYGTAMAGVAYLNPAAAFSDQPGSPGLAYAVGTGMIYNEVFHLGIRYQRSHQGLDLLSPKHPSTAGYLCVVAGVHF